MEDKVVREFSLEVSGAVDVRSQVRYALICVLGVVRVCLLCQA